jgi:hypothetical protein
VLDREAVLQTIGDVQAGIESDEAGWSGGNFRRGYGELGILDDKTKQIDAIEMEKIGDGARSGAVVEDSCTAAKDSFGF